MSISERRSAAGSAHGVTRTYHEICVLRDFLAVGRAVLSRRLGCTPPFVMSCLRAFLR